MPKATLLFLICFLYALPNMAQYQEKSNPNFHREISGGLFWHPRGLGLNLKAGKKLESGVWRMIDLDLVSMKHEKERRVRSASFSAPGSFFYGKLNTVFIARGGYGRRWDLSTHFYKHTIATRFQVSAGPSIAMLKPVYLEIYYPTPDNQAGFLVSEKYDPEKHTDPTVIFGNSSFFSGISGTKGRLGLNFKANMQFDWSDYYDQVQGVELGMVIDAFGRDIPILALASNKNIFTTLYICLNIGNSW